MWGRGPALYKHNYLKKKKKNIPPPLFSKSGLNLVCNVNILYGNLTSENSQDYVRKPNELVRS